MQKPLLNKKYLMYAGILSFAFLVRILFNFSLFFDNNNALLTDSSGYIHLAKSLHDGFHFPSVLRTPGYPFFISLIWWLIHTQSIIAVVLFQIFIDSFTGILIAITGGFFIRDKGWNKMGAIFYALNPLAIYYSGKSCRRHFLSYY